MFAGTNAARVRRSPSRAAGASLYLSGLRHYPDHGIMARLGYPTMKVRGVVEIEPLRQARTPEIYFCGYVNVKVSENGCHHNGTPVSLSV